MNLIRPLTLGHNWSLIRPLTFGDNLNLIRPLTLGDNWNLIRPLTLGDNLNRIRPLTLGDNLAQLKRWLVLVIRTDSMVLVKATSLRMGGPGFAPRSSHVTDFRTWHSRGYPARLLTLRGQCLTNRPGVSMLSLRWLN